MLYGISAWHHKYVADPAEEIFWKDRKDSYRLSRYYIIV